MPSPPTAMTRASLLRLLLLSALWGASFLFLRLGVGDFGPYWLILGRVFLAALFLLAVAHLVHASRPPPLRDNRGHFLVLGLFNSALPFLLLAIAARHLSVALLAVLNATAPVWAALIEALRQRRPPPAPALAGLGMGMAGVAILAGTELSAVPAGNAATLTALAAGLGAPLCYGIATTWAKSASRAVPPFANAHGSMWAATLLLAPAALFVPPPAALPGAPALGALLGLGILCSGIAYLLYFRLVADIGPAGALTVTFLIPAFGILWGALFLGEPVGGHTLLGSAAVLAGTALVTGLPLRPGRRGDAS